MNDYVKLATIYVEEVKDSMNIAQVLINAGYTVAYSIDYSEIYILKENNYDTK